MTPTLFDLKKLTDAEEYFRFFQISFDAKVVNVNRLHILKKFSQYVYGIDQTYPTLEEAEKLIKYREALQQAYELFLTSTAVKEKLFKVFNDKHKNVILLSEITAE